MADRIRPEQVIDLTAPGTSLRYVEILTPGGIVRVNTCLEDTRTRRPVVVVEVEPNTAYRQRTAPGGNWEASARDRELLGRVDVTLTRQAEGEGRG